MIYLLPAAGCSILIAVILKLNEARGGNRILLAAANYAVASVVAFLLLGGKPPSLGTVTLVLGAVTGIVYVLGFLILMAGIGKGPLAVPVTVMRLSVAVPVVAAIFLWGEKPGPVQAGGIFLGLTAIILFGFSIGNKRGARRAEQNFWILMVAIFLVMGSGDVLLKAFREMSPDTERLAFTWVLFSLAAIFTWIVLAARRIPLDRRTFLWGMVLGVPNLFSTVFTLLALRSTPASIAFPFINLTVIFGSTLLGFTVWKERLGTLALVGLVVAAAALILLPLK
ncbi:MAG: EamA family transporter [Candidatus Krumholzibacteriota bacterium]|nr:EamA family transporter [Candidatus Krumholzibacteriota bacterium]